MVWGQGDFGNWLGTKGQVTPSETARALAPTLTNGVWTQDAIRAAFTRRLPERLHAHIHLLAEELVDLFPQRVSPTPFKVAQSLRFCAHFQPIAAFYRRAKVPLSPDLEPAIMAPAKNFATLGLPDLPSFGALSDWLGVNRDFLSRVTDPAAWAEAHGEMGVNNYHYHLLPKASGSHRLIEAPKEHLKAVQRQIATQLLAHVPVHGDAYGFVQGRNCLMAAAKHAGEEGVLCLDLANFFPSLAGGRVFGLFRLLGYPNTVARALTGLCTNVTPARVRNRMPFDQRGRLRGAHLPQGAPTSPVLANLLSYSLDRRLSGLARSLALTYTRYADDLTFSGDISPLRVAKVAAESIVKDEGFSLNHSKTRLQSAGNRQVVTGIVVNQHVNTTRKSFDHLKAVIHSCSDPADTRLCDPRFAAKLMGQIDWVRTVNPNRGAKLDQLLERAMVRRCM